MPERGGIAADESDSSTMSTPEHAVSRHVAKGLRRCAFRATEMLRSMSPTQLHGTVCRLLQSQARAIDAIDIQLFRARLDNAGTGRVGLRYHSGWAATDADLATLKHFQFQLLSAEVQKCLRADQIAEVRAGSTSGGRLITGLMKQLDCSSYILCPLHVDGRLRGILGVACREVHNYPEHDEFFELLKLNGSILLNNVLRIRQERKRSRKLRQWKRIADQACDFAFCVDDRFVICNTTTFGADEATPKLLGLRLTDVVVRSFHRELKEQIQTAVKSGDVRTFDFKMSLDHCEPRWFLARIEPMGTACACWATLYLTDNHSDKVLQEEVRDLTEQLVKASRLSLLGQMSTEFSHQLNQPLQAILNYCNLVQRRFQKGTANADNCRDALASIEKSVIHSADIIQGIRNFVKFKSLSTEPVLVDELLQQATMMVIPTTRGRDADLIPAPESPNLTVVVDKAQTTHVLVNLIINALEACCECGIDRPRIELLVRAVPEHGRVTVSVRDNGPGLPADDTDIVFRKFYSGRKDGLGMGLAISREVCESQGGSLDAQNNTPEKGCTFHLIAPIHGVAGIETAELEIIDDTTIPAD
ncbi:MAG: hypothetical protein GY903_03025 [Fuerstiella sp.]|nr:hypothetical protein [Fuerstiella sp.]MCP4853447.1 hypothetical protein [Fuerstiella sp.]